MNQTLLQPVFTFFESVQKVLLRYLRVGEQHPHLTGAVVFIVSLGMFLCYYSFERVLSRDSVTYLDAAEQMANTGWLTYAQRQTFPPLLVVLIAKLTQCGISPLVAGMMINLSAAAAVPLLTYAIAGRIFHHYATAVLCGILMLLHPQITPIAVAVQRDIPGLALQMLAFYFFLYSRERCRNGWMFWSGTALAASIHFRYENLEFTIVLPVFLLADYFSRHGNTARKLVSAEFPKYVFLPICIFAAGFIFGMILGVYFCRNTSFFADFYSRFNAYSYLLSF